MLLQFSLRPPVPPSTPGVTSTPMEGLHPDLPPGPPLHPLPPTKLLLHGLPLPPNLSRVHR